VHENKRDSERLQILGDLLGEVMVFQPMAIKEISTGGAQVETAFPLHLDSLHELRLTLGDQSVVVKGRVVHCSIAMSSRKASSTGPASSSSNRRNVSTV